VVAVRAALLTTFFIKVESSCGYWSTPYITYEDVSFLLQDAPIPPSSTSAEDLEELQDAVNFIFQGFNLLDFNSDGTCDGE